MGHQRAFDPAQRVRQRRRFTDIASFRNYIDSDVLAH
jgi:hypothetical protein